MYQALAPKERNSEVSLQSLLTEKSPAPACTVPVPASPAVLGIKSVYGSRIPTA